MADEDQTAGSEAEGLQFDQAEYREPAAAAPTCAACKQPIADAYYGINGGVFCARCRDLIQEHLAGGSGLRRFLRAGLFGAGAAVGGFALYFAVLKLTGYEIGLIAIVVGFMVGAAVRSGARHRGGWAYQGLAILLTYLAIAASYSAAIVPQLLEEMKTDPAGAAPADLVEPADLPRPAAVAKRDPAPPAAAPPAGAADVTAVQMAVGLAVVLGFALALPILAGFQQPIGLLIVAFALYEAWKINRRTPLVITGPHPIGDRPEPQGVPGHA